MQAAAAPPRLSAFARWSDRHFKWLLVAPAVAPHPGAVDLSAALLAGRLLHQLRLPGAGPRLRRAEEFRAGGVRPVARWSLVLTAMLSGASVAIEFVLGLAVALTMVRDFRGRGLIMSILIVPLFISPVIVGQAWTLLLQRPFGPTNYILSQILGQEVTISWLTESPWLYHLAHPRRRLAVDAVHVRHPARRADRDPAQPLRGGRARRRQRLAGVLGDHRAASRRR